MRQPPNTSSPVESELSSNPRGWLLSLAHPCAGWLPHSAPIGGEAVRFTMPPTGTSFNFFDGVCGGVMLVKVRENSD